MNSKSTLSSFFMYLREEKELKEESEGLPSGTLPTSPTTTPRLYDQPSLFELAIPHPRTHFSCRKTGIAVAHPTREVTGWRCVWGGGREAPVPWGRLWAWRVNFQRTHRAQHGAGEVLWMAIRPGSGGLEGQDDAHNQGGDGDWWGWGHATPECGTWYTEEFKLKEFEKTAEAGRSFPLLP